METTFTLKELRIPEKFHAAGQDYKVIMCETDEEFNRLTGTDDAFGVTLKLKKIVYLNLELHLRNGATSEQIRETFYHECGHCLLEEAGISAAISDEMEEVIVDLYSKYIKTIKTGVRK